ncbi:hypothetical protein BDC45DRAFT_510518, partial [Circinella umbellata]
MPRSIVLVLDGESLPIKSETHDKRDQYATSKFKEAKELYKSRGIKNKNFIAAAKSAVRFTSDIKTAIIEILKKTYQTFDPLADFLPAVYYYQAPYEADGMIIKLASMLPSPQNQTAIISSDSDLLVYKRCLDVMRIMEIKWGAPSIGSIISTTKLCTKRDILQKLHLKHQDDSTFDMAEKRLM